VAPPPSQGLGEGENGPSYPTPGTLMLSLSKKHKTLEIHVLYDERKKYLMFPPPRKKTVYFVLCKVLIKTKENMVVADFGLVSVSV
jgi:hypothetical protein